MFETLKEIHTSLLVRTMINIERSGRRMLRAGRCDTPRFYDLTSQWEEIAEELGRRSATVNGLTPATTGFAEGQYNFGDAIC